VKSSANGVRHAGASTYTGPTNPLGKLPGSVWTIPETDPEPTATDEESAMTALGEAHIIRGNALNLPLPDSSVDLICTSPPYFSLRSYQDAGEHYAGQIGSEATPAEFLDALIAATREMMRVLKPTGSIFVNLGDKYSGAMGQTHGNAQSTVIPRSRFGAIPNKSLMGMPWRYAIRCIDELGLILRAEIIWAKPNGLPESVTDRVRRSHEQWFHLTRSPKYFSAVDEIREPHLQPDRVRADVFGGKSAENGVRHAGASTYTGPTSSLGKLPGSVWTVPTQPLTVPPELGVDHFAAYPMEWPRRIIQGWTPNGICVECGEGRRPDTVTEQVGQRAFASQYLNGSHGQTKQGGGHAFGLHTITGYMCGCPTPTAPTRPSVILDPFGGTGTTALVAKALGRTGISIDLSADYCRLAEWRTNDPRELAAALQVEKPEPVHPDQLDLFSEQA
jgi:DNA modification methylase